MPKTIHIKPTLIDRYIIAQCLPYFGISVAVFTFVFLTHQLLDIMNFIVNYNIGFKPVILMIGFSIPYFLVFVIPISTMLSVLLVFLGMTHDNEIVALKSSGVSMHRLLYPALIFCICTCLFTAFMSIWALPRGKSAFKTLAMQIVTTSPDLGIEEREFNSTFRDMTLYVGEFDKKNRVLSDIFIEDQSGRRGKKGAPVTICAPTGSFRFDPETRIFRLTLHSGVINQVNFKERSIHNIRFDRYEVNIYVHYPVTDGLSALKDEKEMTFAELSQFIQTGNKNDERHRAARLEWHKKFSLPFACIVLGLLAVPLGMRAKGRRQSSGIGLSLGFFLIYYLLLSGGEILGESGRLHPVIGMWMPNAVMGVLAAYLAVIEANDRSFDIPIPKRLNIFNRFKKHPG
ncbi:MAG: LPS export ABC transporter permease LptF [Thermodesulfobacteriota bacterium]|nr:LPS export ABC transporter permease LptF [Thermodesulfobacteriota bacterium]